MAGPTSFQLISYEPQQTVFEEVSRISRKIKHFDISCPICLENYSKTDQVTVLVCQHIFHASCLSRSKKKECPFDKKPIDGSKKVTLFDNILMIPNRVIHDLNQNNKLLKALSKIMPLLPPEIRKKIVALLVGLKKGEDIWEFCVRNQEEIAEIISDLLLERIRSYQSIPHVKKEIQALFMFLQDLIDIFNGSVTRKNVVPLFEKIWKLYHRELTMLLGPVLCEDGINPLNIIQIFYQHKQFLYILHLSGNINRHELYPQIQNRTYLSLYVRQVKEYRNKSTLGRYKMIWNMSFFKKINLYERCGDSKTSKDIKSKITQVWAIKAVLGIAGAVFCKLKLF